MGNEECGMENREFQNHHSGFQKSFLKFRTVVLTFKLLV